MASNTYGAIKLSTAEDVGAVLKKKTGSADGYKPKEWADTINLLGLLPIRTASGTIAHFEDGAENVPMKSVVANILPIQSGTGTPSPSNPRPISGTSVLNVTSTGANLIDPSTIEVSGTIQVRFFREDNILLKKGVTYKFVYLGTNQATLYFAQPVSGTYAVGTGKVLSFTPSEDCYAWLQALNLQGIETEYNKFVLTCDGSEPTTYEPYTGSTYTINLGQTVYGGTADVVGGVGESTHGIADLSDSSNNWTYTNGVFYSAPIYPVTYLATYNRILCSIYKDVYVVTSAEMNNNEIRCYSNRLYIKDSRFSDVASFVAGITGEKVCYELATPTSFTFTGQPINSYIGVNNVWTDSGEVLDVEYRADMNILIAELGG